MKYVDEFRQPALVDKLIKKIEVSYTRPWTIMEVCGGQTHSIVKSGLEALLPVDIRLIHGPGCPVCVTSIDFIDHAIFISQKPNTILCSFGDMLRVPGTNGNLLKAKAKGADVRIIHSPIDAVQIAHNNPTKDVTLFAVGFETTAPANAMAVELAKNRNLSNFFILCSHVLVPPAITKIMSDRDCKVDGFLAAGHVCTVTGFEKYHALAKEINTPIVITGFEPVDILEGILSCIELLEKKQSIVKNQYKRCVKEQGNPSAINILHKIFRVTSRDWRGLGNIPDSGLDLKEEWAQYDARGRFPFFSNIEKSSPCLSGLVLQGKIKPCECPFFGNDCTPENPLGAPMVSTEGACSAYYLYNHELKLC